MSFKSKETHFEISRHQIYDVREKFDVDTLVSYMKAPEPSVDNKCIEDLFWAVCTENNPLKVEKAVKAFQTHRPEYFKKHILEFLQNDDRFQHFVEPITH